MSDNILKKTLKPLSLALGASLCLWGSASFAAPQNISDVTRELVRYHDSGQYQHEFEQVAHQATAYLEKQANPAKKQAIILDIDETTLSQWPEMKANQFAYFPKGTSCHLPEGPCTEKGWVRKEAAIAFPSTRELIETAQKHHVAVFFITGRSVKYRHHMIKNLHKEDIYDWTGLYMRGRKDKSSATDYKTPIRKEIEKKGYEIILNMGDQKTDLQGGHGGKTFLLPNPFYTVP